jgi:hypothetical protein
MTQFGPRSGSARLEVLAGQPGDRVVRYAEQLAYRDELRRVRRAQCIFLRIHRVRVGTLVPARTNPLYQRYQLSQWKAGLLSSARRPVAWSNFVDVVVDIVSTSATPAATMPVRCSHRIEKRIIKIVRGLPVIRA